MKILFSFDTIPINDINKTKQISNVDTTLWHERLGHFNNKDIINFVIEHTYNLIIKIIINAKKKKKKKKNRQVKKKNHYTVLLTKPKKKKIRTYSYRHNRKTKNFIQWFFNHYITFLDNFFFSR